MSTKPANQKRRNNEKRKEKSRVAARCRRTKEMQIFSELTAALPAKKEEVEQLDKASVMRLAISYLRVRDVVTLLPETKPPQPTLQIPKNLQDVSSELSYMKALDGFVLVLSQQGDIVYCSENISEHLGVSQMEIMGQSVFEFSHPCDHEEVREALRGGSSGKRELLLRLKCTLTGKGRNVHLKSASYKVIHVTGHMLLPPEQKKKKNIKDGDEQNPAQSSALVAVGRPIPHPSNIEIPLDSKTFLSKHSLDMKFTYTDEALLNTLGFSPGELVGKSLYEYHHAGDSAALAHQFKCLFSKGQCETGQYRFLAKTGGYAWVQTQATLITDKQQKPISVVCVNYVVSGIESKDEVLSAQQLQLADLKPAVPPPAALAPRAPAPTPVFDAPNGSIVAVIPQEDERPIPVTELIFAPRKKEMNKGFLMFSQDEGMTMLKDEPEDLTHLAPTAGDACIPLENSPFDMFDEFILSDSYCTDLLSDELANGSPVDSLTTSDTLLLSSPEHQETDSSSCDQSSLLTEISLEAFDCGRSENETDDGKFLPLSDELPLLEPAVMWGALPDSVSLAKPQPSTDPLASQAPALQRLLASPATGPPPHDLITNIYSDQGLIPSKSFNSWDTGVKRVLRQEEVLNAKRTKRSPSPATAEKPAGKQSSSVLMNLLDIPASLPRGPPSIPNFHVMTQQNLQSPRHVQLLNSKQVIINPPPNHTLLRTISKNSMTPLSLNVTPYSMPSSPNSFGSISPAQKDRMLHSPYSNSLSPQAKYMFSPGSTRASPVIQNDPYMINKMQPSPCLSVQSPIDSLLDPNVSLPSPDYWNEEMLQTPGDLLNDMGELKMV